MRLTELLLKAGIVGCGGAGFPTHVKYNAENIEWIIVNGAECEPLLMTDHYLMREKADALIEAAEYLLRETGAKRFTIALKETYRAEIAALTAAVKKAGSKVELYLMPSFFPAGDEVTMVYEVTGRVVPPGGIPMAAGCVVSNVATVYCVYNALHGHAFTQKYLTVTGEVREPSVLRVPLGTPVSECIRMAGGTLLKDYVVVNGGPMMGKLMTKAEADAAFVTKTMSGLIVLPPENAIGVRAQVPVQHMLNRAKSACIQCSFCTQLCPRNLLGHPIAPHRIMRKMGTCTDISLMLDDPDIRNASFCCECGICEVYACPMGLQPRRVNSLLKRELGKAGIRNKAPEKTWEALPEREVRRAPTHRVAARAGVAKYEGLRFGELKVLKPEEASSVTLSLHQGIGKDSVPCVKTGDHVDWGQVIAEVPEKALGSMLHASISGTVRVTEQAVQITADRQGKGAR